MNTAMKPKIKTHRHYARRCAVQALYQHNLTDSSWLELVEQFLTTSDTPPKLDVDYFTHLVQGTVSNLNEIDNNMILFLDRDIQDVSLIELAILRLAFFELLYTHDIPPKVVLNEAIELAKSFGSVTGYKYVNAVLDKFLKHPVNNHLGEK
jgi:N utilization substance protein B